MTRDRAPITSVVSRSQLLRIAVGFVVAGLLLAILAAGIGIEELRAALSTADLGWIAAACLSTCASFTAWTWSWRIILGVADVDEPFRKLLVTYAAATFGNYVTPMGQAGGEPIIAYVLARETGASYEDSFASVMTADLLNLAASFGLATLSVGVIVWRSDLPEAVEPVAGGLAAVAVGALAIATIGWRFRRSLEQSVARSLAPVVRLLPGVTIETFRERLRELRTAFDRIAAEPWALVRALAVSYLGWILFVLPLYFAGRALGLAVDPLVAFFVVSASMLAGIVPSPGGLGSVEAALTGLLVALVALNPADAYAVALVYRLTTYWFALVVGGLAALAVVRRY